MATVNFRIRSKTNKEVTIYVYLSTGRGKMFQCKTGFTINPKNWSNTTNKPKQNDETGKSTFNNLSKLETFIYKEVNIDNGKGIDINTHWLDEKVKECFNRVERSDNTLVSNHYQHIIDNASTRVVNRKKIGLSKNRTKSYLTSLNLILQFEQGIKQKLHFTDINKPMLERFKNWLLNDKSYSKNHAGKQIDNLKTVCLDAKKLDIPTNSFVENIESFSEANEDRHIVTLSPQELDIIENTTLKKEALINARKWLLIGCEIGQRGNDLLNLTSTNVKNENGLHKIELKQEKTLKDATIPVLPRVKRVLDSGFPYKISTQRFNEYIKKVCETAKIEELIVGRKMDPDTKRVTLGTYPKHELITSHSCRRSFATNYYKTIPTSVLMEITAHSRETIFLAYINKPKDKDENAKLMLKYLDLAKRTKPEKNNRKAVKKSNQ